MVCTFFKYGRGGVYVSALLQAFSRRSNESIGEFQKPHTGFVALLLDLVASENGSDNSFGIVPDLSRPFYEVIAVPLHVLLAVLQASQYSSHSRFSVTTFFWSNRNFGLSPFC